MITNDRKNELKDLHEISMRMKHIDQQLTILNKSIDRIVNYILEKESEEEDNAGGS